MGIAQAGAQPTSAGDGPTPGETPTNETSREPAETHGQIEAVTVYRGQALVTRVVPLPDGGGTHRVVVGDLPAMVIGGSVYAEAEPDSGVEIRSLQYRTRAVAEDTRAEVRELDQQLQAVGRELASNEARGEILDQQRELLTNLQEFTAPSAEWELARGVLNSETLTQITTFMFDQIERIRQAEVEQRFAREELQQRQNRLQRERQQLASSSSRTVREAVASVSDPEGGGRFRLRYLVGSATWSPSYNLRAESGQPELSLEYLAQVQQTTGEAWEDVAMTLSTASPSLVAEPPQLTGFEVSLSQRMPESVLEEQAADESGSYREQVENLALTQQRLQKQRASASSESNAGYDPSRSSGGLFGDSSGPAVAPGAGPDEELDRQLNEVANQRSLLGIRSEQPSEPGPGGGQDDQAERSVSVTYDLLGRTSLPSRSDQQLVRIAKASLESEMYRTAVPVLTEYVYREAELSNTLGVVLLDGPMRSYLDGAFVGRGDLPVVAPQEGFTVGLGVDPSLRAQRELTRRETSVQGGNRVITLDYRLALSNFADEPRRVRVLDRLPDPAESADIRVELLEPNPEPIQASADDGAEQTPTQPRWDVEVPASATGDDAMEVTYTLRLSFDRQRMITSVEE